MKPRLVEVVVGSATQSLTFELQRGLFLLDLAYIKSVNCLLVQTTKQKRMTIASKGYCSAFLDKFGG